MAVYTDISETELARFLEHYDIGDLLSYKGIAEGVENSNYVMRTTAGTYILTLYERRVDPADLPFFLGLMEHLQERGVTCPLPVRRRDGAQTGTLAGRPAAIITFLEGMWLRRPAAAHCREVGRSLAQMHLAGRDFALTRRNALTLEDWRPLWMKSREAAGSLEPGLVAEVEDDLDALERGWSRNLPSGVIHADLFPNNVFFIGQNLSGLIDFYFACNDLYAYDLSVCLNAWCFERDGAFNLTKGRALFDGYESVRPLERAEKAAMPLLARGSAMRFMLTRLYDWVNTPPGSLVVRLDPMEYVRKLRFHRGVPGSSSYGLDA